MAYDPNKSGLDLLRENWKRDAVGADERKNRLEKSFLRNPVTAFTRPQSQPSGTVALEKSHGIGGFTQTPQVTKTTGATTQNKPSLNSIMPAHSTQSATLIARNRLRGFAANPSQLPLQPGEGWIKNEETGDIVSIGQSGRMMMLNKDGQKISSPTRGFTLNAPKPEATMAKNRSVRPDGLQVEFDPSVSQEARKRFFAYERPVQNVAALAPKPNMFQQKEQMALDSLRQRHDMMNRYLTETDPAKKDLLADDLRAIGMLREDTNTWKPVTTKDVIDEKTGDIISQGQTFLVDNNGRSKSIDIPGQAKLLPQNPKDRVIGEKYRSPSGVIGTWTEKGMMLEYMPNS